MAIIVSGASTSALDPLTAAEVISRSVSEVQDRFTNGRSQALDYVDQIQRKIVRHRRWDWMLSDEKYFLTRHGRTDYWVGPTGSNTAAQVDTELDLDDIHEVMSGSVLNRTGYTPLHRVEAPPMSEDYQFEDGTYDSQEPRFFRSLTSNPRLLQLYPAADAYPDYEQVPYPPNYTVAAGGSLDDRIYYVRLTFVDELGNEGLPSEAKRIFVPASNRVTILSPTPLIDTAASGVGYTHYNVYAVEDDETGDETLQNASPIAIGTNHTELTTGLLTNLADPPTGSDLEPLGGWVVSFRYYRALQELTTTDDELLVPARYLDVMVAGVNWLGSQWNASGTLHHKKALDWERIFREGVVSMVKDQNPSPSTHLRIQADIATRYTRL